MIKKYIVVFFVIMSLHVHPRLSLNADRSRSVHSLLSFSGFPGRHDKFNWPKMTYLWDFEQKTSILL